jgi:hypothetical protein
VSGNVGPDQNVANNFYRNSTVQVRIVGNGIQSWIAPFGGSYLIEASGAQGVTPLSGHTGGLGAYLQAQFLLQKGAVLFILVGQVGFVHAETGDGCGGGASFVAVRNPSSADLFLVTNENVSPLLIAAGGGGGGDSDNGSGDDIGRPGLSSSSAEGGGTHLAPEASSGSGYRSNGSHSGTKSFLNGGDAYAYPVYNTQGGFGGGGFGRDGGGGGGGYRGGNSSPLGAAAYGGYSFSALPTMKALDGANSGSGKVEITFLGCTASTTQSFSPSFLFWQLLFFFSGESIRSP